ncbi:Uncharacterised protein [Legionella israelensis]|nr:Uncharacterised protein [Legionella israelensis]
MNKAGIIQIFATAKDKPEKIIEEKRTDRYLWC